MRTAKLYMATSISDSLAPLRRVGLLIAPGSVPAGSKYLKTVHLLLFGKISAVLSGCDVILSDLETHPSVGSSLIFLSSVLGSCGSHMTPLCPNDCS